MEDEISEWYSGGEAVDGGASTSCGERAIEVEGWRADDAGGSFKKTGGLRTAQEKRAYIRNHLEEFGSVRRGCEVTGLSVSGYYYRPKMDPAERERKDADLRDRIEKIQAEFPGYGYRRVKLHLGREGLVVNEKRIRRVMREHGLFPEIKRAWVATTDSDHGLAVYPNLIKDRRADGPNQIWVADITYIRIATCFVYLAVILDLFSRKVIGWAISRSLHKELAVEALKMALEERRPPEGCIHHSDRGVQYASNDYVELLLKNGIRISMSRRGNPYDNAFAESFMKTLKYEEVYLWDYETYTDVLERIPYFIEEVYNKKRLHSAIGYLPPNEYEQLMIEKTTTMACKPLLNSEAQHSS